MANLVTVNPSKTISAVLKTSQTFNTTDVKGIIKSLGDSSVKPSEKKIINENFEKIAKKFVGGNPDILFIADYIVENELLGSLLVIDRYFDATHYEFYKRNVFNKESKFERILFLDFENLEQETSKYMSYINDVLGFKELQKSQIFVIFDHLVKKDRIYEYNVKAARVPKNVSEVDYYMLL